MPVTLNPTTTAGRAVVGKGKPARGGGWEGVTDLTTTLRYACTFIVPNLREGAHDEINNLLHALNGGYIPPGPSGAPTRGMAHVLPTGRNFYSVDPRALPTVASWQVGQGLAADLLKRYDREEGGYPESVGISIWGTSAMRTWAMISPRCWRWWECARAGNRKTAASPGSS